MFFQKFQKWFDSENYYLNKANRLLDRINKLENQFINMSKDDMLHCVCEIRHILSNRSYCTNDKIYDDTVCTIFAIVREVSKRVRDERHFNAQIIAALCLNECVVIEMKTGQGKTLAAVLSAVYRSLSGGCVHILTVNDYLAERDYKDMLSIYEYLNITVGYIIKNVSDITKKSYYKCSVVYISNCEIGFDYLKSNMRYEVEEILLTDASMKHAIIDEADSIMVDNARIPIVIGQCVSHNSLNQYYIASKIVYDLSDDDVEINFREKDVFIKEISMHVVESLIEKYASISINNIYDPEYVNIWFYIDRLLRAKYIFRKNYEYIVANFKVYLVDEYTGRVASDRKYSNGIQQAIEAKENLYLSSESIQANYITTQNLYRKYKYLSGMTGTAYTERHELYVVFAKKVVCIPKEEKDNTIIHRTLFFKNKEYKYESIAKKITERHKKLQPILVGTSNIQESEELSIYLQKYGIVHRVLNAKKLSQEATIIADAGIPGMVTIATNVAGRGTDIKLGGSLSNYYKRFVGNKKFNVDEEQYYKEQCKLLFEKNRKLAISSGGLLMIISQKQENRRIDNQFKGRTGRRSDNGEIMFYVSLEDDIFKHDENNKKVLSLFMDDNNGICSYILESLVTRLQKNIEKVMFETRISTLNQDHVLNKNRDAFFKIRNKVLHCEIDYIVTIQIVLENMKLLMLNDSKNFEDNFRKIILVNMSEKIEIAILFGFVENAINSYFTYDFIQKHYNEIRLLFLIELDNLWKEFINVKDVYRRLSNFRSKIDYILDYNKQMCELFDKIFKKYEFILLRILYDYVIKCSVNNKISIN